MRFQVGRLGKSLVAIIKWTHIRTIASMNSYVSTKIEIQRKSFSTAFKCALQSRKNTPNGDYCKFLEVKMPGKRNYSGYLIKVYHRSGN